jgi:hypothetical protein
MTDTPLMQRTPTDLEKQLTEALRFVRDSIGAVKHPQILHVIDEALKLSGAPTCSPLESGDSGVLDREKIQDDHTQGVLEVTYPKALKPSGVHEGELSGDWRTGKLNHKEPTDAE